MINTDLLVRHYFHHIPDANLVKLFKISGVISAIISIAYIVIGALGIAGTGGVVLMAAGSLILGALLAIGLLGIIGVRVLTRKLEERAFPPPPPPTPLRGKERPCGVVTALVHPARRRIPIWVPCSTTYKARDAAFKLPVACKYSFEWSNCGVNYPLDTRIGPEFSYNLMQCTKIMNFLGEDDNRRPHYPSTEEAKKKLLNLFEKSTNTAARFVHMSFDDACIYASSHKLFDPSALRIKILSHENLHFKLTFFVLPWWYYFIRFLHLNCAETLDDDQKQKIEEQFYTPGTAENRFRELYNDFCKRARLFLEGESQAEGRLEEQLFLCSKEDLNPDFQQPDMDFCFSDYLEHATFDSTITFS
ncbi:hypothetical protein [Chlamydia vaughanii]|uniref:hypothetical protein n=1 Tax=Chlamydia vaughanii TaxID=3112552 RepID=UPI0032B2669F